MSCPPISCVCLTFGRPQRILEEAVYSFLQQDYPGEKELLILNDFAQQTIVFDHPEVTVVNVATRFLSVGEKRNRAVALSRHDLLAVWDDDDISLPHRLSFSVSHYDERRRYFKSTQSFSWNKGKVSGPRTNRYHAASMWHRSLFDEVGGYPAIGSGEDDGIEAKFKKIIGPEMSFDNIEPRDIYYLYRWSGTGSYHLSGFGRDTPETLGQDRVMKYVLTQLERGEIAAGEIYLRPHWEADYSQMVREHVAELL